MNKVVSNHQYFSSTERLDWNLWLRWIFANMVGELVGLGAVALTGALFVLYLANLLVALGAVAAAALMIAAGTFEGAMVGIFQAKVLRTKIAGFNQQRWIFATTVGAATAWVLGMIPSLVMSFAENAPNASPPEMSEAVIGLSAAGMGFALGLVLGFPQWFELRRYAKNAGWWIFANAAAWTIGMPQLFAAPSAIGEALPVWQTAFIIFAAIVSAGASVGAVHGLFLVWILKSKLAFEPDNH